MSYDHSENIVWDTDHLRLAIQAAGVTLWSWNVDTDKLTMDDRAFDLWGVPRSDTVIFEDLSAHIHPADRDRVRAAFAATRAIIGPYEIDFRILVRDDVRWISARGKVATPISLVVSCLESLLMLPAASRLRKVMSCLPVK